MKKFTLLTLVAAMLLSMAACGNGSGKETETTVSTADTVAAETEPAETTVMDTLVKEDYDGATFRILGEVMHDIYTVEEQTGEVLNDAVYQRNSAVNELYNIALEYDIVEWKTGPNIIMEMTTAGDKNYDLLTSTHQYLGKSITSGCYRSWSETDRVTLDSPWYIQAANDTYSIGDNTMLLFGDFLESTIRCTWAMVFNQSKAADHDMPDLYAAVDEGRWTIDYMMEVTNDLYVDTDGDGSRGEGDFYGFITDSVASLDSFGRTCGLSAISKDAKNYPVLDFYKDSTPTAYDKLYQLFYESTGTFASPTAFSQPDNFSNGNGVISNVLLVLLERDQFRNMEENFGVLPYPKLTESQEMGYSHLDGTFSAQMLSVTLSDEDVQRTATVTEALNALGYDMVRPALYDVVLKTKLTRDEDSVRMLDLVMAGRRFSFDSLDEDGFKLSPAQAIRNLLGKKNKDIASYYAKNEESCRKWIDNIVEAYEQSQK